MRSCYCSDGEVSQGQVVHALQGQAGRIKKAIDPVLKGVAVQIKVGCRFRQVSLVLPHGCDQFVCAVDGTDRGLQGLQHRILGSCFRNEIRKRDGGKRYDLAAFGERSAGREYFPFLLEKERQAGVDRPALAQIQLGPQAEVVIQNIKHRRQFLIDAVGFRAVENEDTAFAVQKEAFADKRQCLAEGIDPQCLIERPGVLFPVRESELEQLGLRQSDRNLGRLA